MNEVICNSCNEPFFYSTTEHSVDCPHCFSSVTVVPDLPLKDEPPEPPSTEE